MISKFDLKNNKNKLKKFLDNMAVRLKHGYVVERFKRAPLSQEVSNHLRCGVVFSIYLYLRLETLQRFRRLRKVDMYRRRDQETREPIFVVGTLLRSRNSAREDESSLRVVYVDKWFNRFQFDFRSSAHNFLSIAEWDLRSFFRRHKIFLGRKNANGGWLSQSLKKRPGRWLL